MSKPEIDLSQQSSTSMDLGIYDIKLADQLFNKLCQDVQQIVQGSDPGGIGKAWKEIGFVREIIYSNYGQNLSERKTPLERFNKSTDNSYVIHPKISDARAQYNPTVVMSKGIHTI
jgi:hypothetical protein